MPPIVFLSPAQRESLALEFVEKGRGLMRREQRKSPFARSTGPDKNALLRAVAHFSQAIEIEPEFWRAWVERASARIQLEDMESARHDALKAADLGMDALAFAELSPAFQEEDRRKFLERAIPLAATADSLNLIRKLLRNDG